VKAVVLVGGEGTRLRPLTETIPKPLIPLVDRPFLGHVLDHLAAHGVAEVILSSPYLEETFHPFLASRTGPPATVWVTEETPLDTAGAIINALDRVGDEPFFVLNGDILTDLDLTAMFAFHLERGAAATISLHQVQDARPFGLVSLSDEDRLLAFREKPAEEVPGFINAGTYVLDPSMFDGFLRGVRVNIEREVFPALIERGRAVFGYPSNAYWMDLGTPEKYLRATFDSLDGRVDGLDYVAPHVDPSAAVSLGAHLGSWVVIGPGAAVGPGAEVEDSVLLAGATAEAGAKVRDSILGPGARVGPRAVVFGAVIAEGGQIPADTISRGARVGAGATYEPDPSDEPVPAFEREAGT
jgi:mannose-1-phosphate guanylyltransferase